MRGFYYVFYANFNTIFQLFLKILKFLLQNGAIYVLIFLAIDEVWLSLVERHVRDVEAAGSNPVTSTSSLLIAG